MQAVSRRQLAKTVYGQLADGQSQQKVVAQLAAYVVHNGLQSSLDQIIAEIEDYAAQNGQVVADVVTARPLQPQARQAVQDLASKITNGKVSLREQIDESLIGGAVIKTPGKVLDASVSGRLRRLKTIA